MSKHQWVEIKYTPIEPEVADDGETIHVFATEGAIEAAENDTAHGCWFCHEALTVDNINDACIALATNDHAPINNGAENGEQD
jgi:hypothetical protein